MSFSIEDERVVAPFAVVPQELLTAANHAQAAALALDGVRNSVLTALVVAPYAGLGLAAAVGDAISSWQGAIGRRADAVRSIADGLRSTADSYLEVEDRVAHSMFCAQRAVS